MSLVKKLKGLSEIDNMDDFNKLSNKKKLKAISVLMAPVTCEVSQAREFLESMEKSCVLQGKMPFIGGARRRRGRRGRNASSDDSGSDTDTSTSTQGTAQPQAQAQAQVPVMQAQPSAAAVQQAAQGDIYDLISIVLVTASAYGAGSLAMASGLDDGITSLLQENGVQSLAQCSSEAVLARKMNAAMIGYNAPDYCQQAQTSMNAIIVGLPLAATALCAWFGVRNPFTIMAEAARSSQRNIAGSLRSVKDKLKGLFTRSAEPSDALRHAAAIAIDAQNAANQASMRSPPGQQRAAAIVASQATINPTMPPPQRSNVTIQQQQQVTPVVSQVTDQQVPTPTNISQVIGNTNTRIPQLSPSNLLSPVAEGDTSPTISDLGGTPESPNYSPTTPPPTLLARADDLVNEDSDEEEEGEIVENETKSSTPTSIGSVSSVDDQGRSVRRSSRRRSGGRKKARKTNKKKAKKVHKHKKKAKKTRKHKNKAHKTRKHRGNKRKGKKGKKTRKH